MVESIESVPSRGPPEIVQRPPGHLHDLPVEFRWETTRRHPYYLVFWEQARMHRQGQPSDDPIQRLLRYAASVMLDGISVTGVPISPRTQFAEMGDVDPAFLSGAVQPLTLRAMAMTLIDALPPMDRAELGAILATTGDDAHEVKGDDVPRSLQGKEAMARLVQYSSTALDSFPVAPLFYIHMGASQRTIVGDVEEQVRRWKQRRGIPEKRIHTGKLRQYLQVWDLREGWTGEDYDRSREQTLKQIAGQTNASLSTVASQYKSAFHMITGHDFTPELWERLMGRFKLSELVGGAERVVSAPIRRRVQSSSSRPVPDSVVSPADLPVHMTGIVEGKTTPKDGFEEHVDLILDIETLMGHGLSDAQIAERLEVDAELIGYFRGRTEEIRGL